MLLDDYGQFPPHILLEGRYGRGWKTRSKLAFSLGSILAMHHGGWFQCPIWETEPSPNRCVPRHCHIQKRQPSPDKPYSRSKNCPHVCYFLKDQCITQQIVKIFE